MSYRVAVVGATGAVGREMLKTLHERNFPVRELAVLASGRSAGSKVSFGEKLVLTVQNLDTFDFRGWDIGLFSPGAAVSAIHAPRAAEAEARSTAAIPTARRTSAASPPARRSSPTPWESTSSPT